MTRTLRTRVLIGLAAGLAALSIKVGLAQPPQAAPAPQAAVNQSDDPILKSFRWRSIGPANMGGRIDDIEGVESDPSTFYVGFATGGVWKTVNNGTTFTPIFDTYPVSSIGDIAIAPSNPSIVWVGTGEPNNRQSSSFGDGIYKSTDAGKTFTNMGLKETQTIARIVVHPKDPNIVYVAVLGHLFGSNKERGVYKTVDGGTTWVNTKFINEDTGFTDLVMDPKDPNVLFAASYQRRRVPWGFNGGGPDSGIWMTKDGAKTWKKLEGNGLPSEKIIGRIGLAISRSNPKVVFAQIEVGASGGTGANVTDDGKQAPEGRGFGGGESDVPAGAAAAAGAAGRGTGGGQRGAGGQAGQAGPAQPPSADRSGVWRSDDGGKTWKVASNNNNRPMYYSQVRVDPTTDQILYTMGASFYKSVDGGKTFRTVGGIAHGDHHGMWIDPKNPRHLILGNDGGLDVSYDQADTWEYVNTMAVGQFYAVSADMRKPYFVCGGLQDNGTFCGPSATRSSNGILNADWYRVGGGDGFYTQQDPTDPNIVYAESQDGNVNRLDLRTGRTTSIRPRAPRPPQPNQTPAQQEQQAAMAAMAAQMGFGAAAGSNIVPEPPATEQYRFYWNTPTLLSPHNPSIVYIGGNRLFISRNRGETFTATKDLTNSLGRFDRPIMGVAGDAPMASKHDGAANYSVIITVAESPVLPGVLWVGTNDGNLQLSRDFGATWVNVVANVPGVPKETHVSRVEASHFDAGTCYVTFDGHRTNDMKPYVFVTKNYGQTWTSLAANLPSGNVNVIREDHKNRNLLFLGTEYGLYVSLDAGKQWKRFMTGLPTVRIDDILVHPRDNDLIAATHGRSFYIVDDITPLQAMTDKVTAADVTLFEPRPGVAWLSDTTLARIVGGSKHFQGVNPQPGTAISYYLKAAATGDVKIAITDYAGKVVRQMDGTKDAGLNRVQWNLRGTPPAAGAGRGGGGGGGGRGGQGGASIDPGTYLLKLSVGGKDFTSKVVVEADEIVR
jgi:photosystem II stability/assembly factor-like uncharacterized protein